MEQMTCLEDKGALPFGVIGDVNKYKYRFICKKK